jgi:hypothetical protein
MRGQYTENLRPITLTDVVRLLQSADDERRREDGLNPVHRTRYEPRAETVYARIKQMTINANYKRYDGKGTAK